MHQNALFTTHKHRICQGPRKYFFMGWKLHAAKLVEGGGRLKCYNLVFLVSVLKHFLKIIFIYNFFLATRRFYKWCTLKCFVIYFENKKIM